MTDLEIVLQSYQVRVEDLAMFGLSESSTAEEADTVLSGVKQRSDFHNDELLKIKQRIDTSKFN